MLLNEITMAGNVGSDARDGTTQGGTRVVTFSLAHNEKGRDGREDTVTWVRVKVFGIWCDLAAGFKKGDNVFVKGKLNVQSYEDKDGNNRTSVDVIPFVLGRIAREEQAHASTQQRQAPRQQGKPKSSPPPQGDMDMDDIPF